MAFVKKVKSLKKEKPGNRISGMSTLEIPVDPIEPATEFAEFAFALFGEKGIGKTSLASEFPDSVIFQLEPGRRHLRVRQVPKPGEDPLTWDTLKQYIELALRDDSIRTIIIDTVDKAWELCTDAICQRLGIAHPNDANDFGKTHREIRLEFENTLNLIKFGGKTPVFVSHAKFRPVENALEGTKIDLYCPTCSDKAWEYLRSVCDYVCCYTYRGPSRVMVLRGNETVWASCGPPDTFLDPKTGKQLAEIPMGSSSKEAYHNLCEGFANRLPGRLVFAPTDQDEAGNTPSDSGKKTVKKVFKKKGS